jgi:hypothetical protein
MRGPAKSKKNMRGSFFLFGAGPHTNLPRSASREKRGTAPLRTLCRGAACPALTSLGEAVVSPPALAARAAELCS